jgi:hypothetical protein
MFCIKTGRGGDSNTNECRHYVAGERRGRVVNGLTKNCIDTWDS